MAAPEDKQRAKGSEQSRSTACQQEQYGANNLKRVTEKEKKHAKSVQVCAYLVLDQNTLPYIASTMTLCVCITSFVFIAVYLKVLATPTPLVGRKGTTGGP